MKNLGFLIGGKSFSGLLGLGYLALAVHTLGVEAYGWLTLIYAFALTVSTIVKFQTWQPILHYGTAALHDGRTDDFKRLVLFTIGLDLASSLVGAALAMGGIWLIGTRIGLPAAILPQASLFGAALLFMVTATPNGLLRLFDRFDLLLVEDNAEAAVRFVGSLTLFLVGGTLTGFLTVWFLSVVASGCTCAYLSWRVMRKHVDWSHSALLVRDAVKSRGRSLTEGFPGIWKFVWSTNFNQTLGLTTNHVATLVVGGLIGAAPAGLFRIARQIADALAKPIKLMTPVFYPELARLVASRRFDNLRELTIRAMRISCLGAFGSFLILCLLGNWILVLIGGHKTVGAYGVMLLLSAAALIRIGTFTLEPTLISLGKPTMALWIQCVAAVVFLPALVALIRYAGIEGAGIAMIIEAVLTAIMQYFAVSYWFRVQARGEFIQSLAG